MVMIAHFFGMQSIGSAWIEQRFWEFYTRENEDDLKDFHFDTKVLLKCCADTTTISWPCWSYERMVKKWMIWWLGTICIFMKLWQVWLNWFQNRYVFQVYDCAVPMRQVPFRNRWSFHPVDQLNFEVCYRTYEGLFCRILGIGCLFRFTQLEGVPRAWIIRNHVTFGTPEFPWDSFRFIWMIGTFGTSFNYDFENIRQIMSVPMHVTFNPPRSHIIGRGCSCILWSTIHAYAIWYMYHDVLHAYHVRIPITSSEDSHCRLSILQLFHL